MQPFGCFSTKARRGKQADQQRTRPRYTAVRERAAAASAPSGAPSYLACLASFRIALRILPSPKRPVGGLNMDEPRSGRAGGCKLQTLQNLPFDRMGAGVVRVWGQEMQSSMLALEFRVLGLMMRNLQHCPRVSSSRTCCPDLWNPAGRHARRRRMPRACAHAPPDERSARQGSTDKRVVPRCVSVYCSATQNGGCIRAHRPNMVALAARRAACRCGVQHADAPACWCVHSALASRSQ